MSKYRVKTEYLTIGAYGSSEKHTLYATHNNSCDIITFYEEDGSILFCVENTEKNNLFDAIQRLYAPFNKNGELIENVEYYSNIDNERNIF